MPTSPPPQGIDSDEFREGVVQLKLGSAAKAEEHTNNNKRKSPLTPKGEQKLVLYSMFFIFKKY
jgi:hypothetical protein